MLRDVWKVAVFISAVKVKFKLLSRMIYYTQHKYDFLSCELCYFQQHSLINCEIIDVRSYKYLGTRNLFLSTILEEEKEEEEEKKEEEEKELD